MVWERMDGKGLAGRFGRQKGVCLRACLEGRMGALYGFGGSSQTPDSLMAILGDFCFLGGKPEAALLRYRDENLARPYTLLIPGDEGWEKALEEHYRGKIRRFQRYAMKKPPEGFDTGRLRRMAETVPSDVSFCTVDEEGYNRCKREAWSRDLVSQFPDAKAYGRDALGILAFKNGVPVSGASAYAACENGIEIEIDTKEEYRRQGLALACGARLILSCLERGISPGWDAQNPASKALAQKLGYGLDFSYTAYELAGGGDGRERKGERG